MFIDIEKTRKYYSNITEDDICSCYYCKLYCAKIKEKYREIAAYLDSIGVDIEKPFETCPVENDDKSVSYYGCQYVVFGNCEEDFFHKIGDVEFIVTDFHPNTGIEEEYFVLDFAVIELNE